METGPLPLDSNDQDGQSSFKVLIAYEDLAAGQRAVRLLSLLDGAQEPHVGFQPQPWRFDLLADSDWAQFAADDALKADMLVISGSTQSDLPQAVKNWLTACLAQKRGSHSAVVALFEAEGSLSNAGSSGLRFVQGAAGKAGLEFFAPLPVRKDMARAVRPETQRVGGTNQTFEESRPSHSFQPRDVPLSPSLQAFNQVTPCAHWGINE